MFNKGIAFSLLASVIIIIAASPIIYAASESQKPLKDRASLPLRYTPSYSIPERDMVTSYQSNPVPVKINLNTRGYRSNPNTVGYTTYGYQHNCTMGRQVEHRNTNFLHFGWMAQEHDTLGQDRGIGYQAYDLAQCSEIFISGGLRIETEYAGYVAVDADPGGWAVVAAHQKNESVYYPSAFWDFTPGGPVFGVFTPDNPGDIYGWWQNSGVGPGNETIWPKIEWHLGTEMVLHMVTAERAADNGDPQTISYHNRIGPYGTGLGSWSDQRVIDTVMNINVTLASSPVSDRVAIVWNAPVDYLRDTPDEFDNQYENDVWYAMSTNQGADWAHDTVSTNLGASSIGHMVDLGIYEGGNITQFPPESDYKAYCDISTLISTQDELHIVWGCRRWTDTTSLYRRQSAIFHWAENTPTVIRPVVFANWDTGGSCYGHAWGSDAAKMTISECDGKLYVLYTQFGSHDYPCSDIDNVNQVVNGRLYMSIMDPLLGDIWDKPQRVTSIPETLEGCDPGDMSGPGDCNSEYWASMARYGRVDNCENPGQNVLDILYINDYAPGGCVQTESGVWTVNPVMWMTTPCRDAVIEPVLYYYPWAVGICYDEPIFVVNPDGDTSFTVMLENYGLAEVNITASVQIDSCNIPNGGNNTVMDISPAAGVLPRGGGVLNLTVGIHTTDEPMNITIFAHVLIEHDAESYPPIKIPVCMTVPNIDWFGPDYFIIETACKKLRIYNNGEISNGRHNEAMDYIDDPDDCANIYLYDGSPIICREIDGEKRCFFTVYEGEYESEHALRPMSVITVDSLSNPSYTMAQYELITADSAIGLRVEHFTPKHPDSCEFIIQRLVFWNRTAETLTSVAVGEYLDWDIPSYDSVHAAYANESNYDATRNLIYQYTCYQDECDTLVEANRAGGIAPYPYWDWKNFMTLENDIYVWMSGPYGSEAPLPDDAIYDLMTGTDGPSIASLDSCEEISTLVTFDIYDLHPGDTLCASAILVTSRDDADVAKLKTAVDMANDFLDNHFEITCGIDFFDPPGDANNDGTVNIGDAVYIIAYIFSGGPAPDPFPTYCGDPNGDCQCNVGDAVYIINYVFGGGSPPVYVHMWSAYCGWPPY
jgi:hypothetical protein